LFEKRCDFFNWKLFGSIFHPEELEPALEK
jgi:hypothetical protein